jgi:hypothetical protein
MASNIDSLRIDATYPVAGIDNDTQGFRDNFAIIKQNFAAAEAEISELQENTAKLNETNNFRGSNINEANLQAITEQFFPIGIAQGEQQPVNGSQNIDVKNGHYQTVVIDENDITLNLIGWVDSVSESVSTKIAKLTVELRNISNNPKEVTWITRGGGVGTAFRLSETMSNPLELDSNSITVVDFWSYTGGATVYANVVGKFQ